MSKPLVIVVPHGLGRAEARRRIERGLSKLGTAFGGQVTEIEPRWDEDRLHCAVKVLGQRLSGIVDVGDDSVRLEAQLPLVLALVADRAKGFMETQGQALFRKT